MNRKNLIRVVLVVSGTIIMGAFGSGLWELVFKPGLSGLGRIILTVITLGSDRLRDSAYESAALDPRPIADLLMLLTISATPLWLLSVVWGIRMGMARYRRDRTLRKNASQERLALIKRNSLRRERRLFLTINVLLICLWMFLGMLALVNNQSVLVWRVFHANLAILEPHLDPTERTLLVSRFHSMQTRDDYLQLTAELRARARQSGVQLRDIPLW